MSGDFEIDSASQHHSSIGVSCSQCRHRRRPARDRAPTQADSVETEQSVYEWRYSCFAPERGHRSNQKRIAGALGKPVQCEVARRYDWTAVAAAKIRDDSEPMVGVVLRLRTRSEEHTSELQSLRHL